PETLLRELDGAAVAGKDRAGEPVRRALVDQRDRFLVAARLVDERGDDGTEQPLAHRPEPGIGRLASGRPDEPAAVVVEVAADETLARPGPAVGRREHA